MRNSETFKITTRGDRELVMTREFDAPRHLVFDAFTKPELVRRWLLGPDGWSMPVCEIDLRVGGSYRYVWRHASGNEMGMGGVFREIVPPERIVSTEKFDHAWYPGEAVGTIVLTEHAGKTTLTQIVDDLARAGLVLVEPVWAPKHVSDIPTLWLRCDAIFDFPKADVIGTNVRRVDVHGDHNSICHDAGVIREIVAFVTENQQ